MYATYEILPGRIVLDYTGIKGEWLGAERIDVPRNCRDLQTLAYNAASQRAALKGVRLERLSQ